eukprot:scaffold6413_cov121-Isochrysis_galbana.AAC.11
MASRPGVQQTRMSRSITSSEPTPMKICDGLHPRRLAMAALSRTCRGSGAAVRVLVGVEQHGVSRRAEAGREDVWLQSEHARPQNGFEHKAVRQASAPAPVQNDEPHGERESAHERQHARTTGAAPDALHPRGGHSRAVGRRPVPCDSGSARCSWTRRRTGRISNRLDPIYGIEPLSRAAVRACGSSPRAAPSDKQTPGTAPSEAPASLFFGTTLPSLCSQGEGAKGQGPYPCDQATSLIHHGSTLALLHLRTAHRLFNPEHSIRSAPAPRADHFSYPGVWRRGRARPPGPPARADHDCAAPMPPLRRLAIPTASCPTRKSRATASVSRLPLSPGPDQPTPPSIATDPLTGQPRGLACGASGA